MMRPDEIVEFDLYLPREGREPVLYRGADLPFTLNDRERLIEHNVDEILISVKDRGAFKRYMERNLGSIVNDDTLPLEERSEILYDTSHSLVHELMDNPESDTMLPRSAAVVDHTVDFLFREENTFHHLMHVTSYDYYTYTHSVNVFVYSMALAQRLGTSDHDLRIFGQGALLHDIGKSRIDPAITNCPGKLTDAQWEEMKRHTLYGAEILQAQGVDNEVVLDVTLHHHEKLTGGGYPHGLSGDEISHWVRICTIADIFDALTTRRTYKDAMHSFPTLQFMREHMSAELDLDIFKDFVQMLAGPESQKAARR